MEKDGNGGVFLGETELGYIKINASEFRNVSLETFSCSYYETAKKLKTKEATMLNLVCIIYHELWHAIQLYKLYKGIIDSESIGHLERQLIEDYIDEDDYVRNYRKQIFENDSEINAYKEAILFYEKFLGIELIKFLMLSKRRIKMHENIKKYSYKEDKYGEKFLNEIYITKYMDRIIKRNPSLLSKYEGLKLIYDDSGNPLDIVRLNNNSKKMGFEFEKYVIARILNLDLRKINLNKIDYDSYKNLVLAFVDIVKNSLSSIDIINNKVKNNKELYRMLVQQKISIIVEISLFLNRGILNERFNTDEMQELYKVLDKYFKITNVRIKEVGVYLNDKKIENYLLKQLTGEKKYGRN